MASFRLPTKPCRAASHEGRAHVADACGRRRAGRADARVPRGATGCEGLHADEGEAGRELRHHDAPTKPLVPRELPVVAVPQATGLRI